MRTRQQRSSVYRRIEGGIVYDNIPMWLETFQESRYPGSNDCLHIRTTASSATGVNTSGQQVVIENHPCPYGYADLTGQIAKVFTALNWDKLPTSTQSGIIQILAELDDTLAIFTRKFWQQLSYGSFTWGVLPFVSDLKAVLSAIKNLNENLADFSYEDSMVVPLNLSYSPVNYYRVTFNGNAIVRKTGRADMSFLSEASQWLDRLGFHPDLATAWDLVPLSFLVDYLLPVGTYLESLRGGGWVKAIRFSGWTTCKITGEWSVTYHGANPTGQFVAFQRWKGDSILVTSDVGFPASEYPSLTELFNLFYVLVYNRRRR